MAYVYDCRPSRFDPRDRHLMVDFAPNLPQQVALPPVPVLDQGQEGSCVGHGSAGARETLELLAKGAGIQVNTSDTPPAITTQTVVPLSRAFLYYEARFLEGDPGDDAGAEPRDACKVMQQTGVCTEADFPYMVGGYATAPPDAAVQAAAAYKIGSYQSLPSPLAIRTALAGGSPVIIGIMVYSSFEQNVGADGLVPLPKPREQQLGGHCLFLYGYHPDPAKPGKFLYDGQNSWSENWGRKGRFSLPEAFVASHRLLFDAWAISL